MGDAVVLGIDMNEDAQTGFLSHKLKLLGLRDGVLSHHNGLSPPATQKRNESREPIDAIWVSSTVNIHRAGFMPIDSNLPACTEIGKSMQ